MPEFVVIMPGKEDYKMFDKDIKELVVKTPERLNFYGIFVPCNGF